MSLEHAVVHSAMHGTGNAFHAYTRSVGQLANEGNKTEPPSAETVIDMWRKGYFNDFQRDKLLGVHGITADVAAFAAGTVPQGDWAWLAWSWGCVIYNGGEMPTTTEMLEIANRQLWDDDFTTVAMKQLGWYRDDVRPLEQNLRYDIPGPSDLVRFSVRHFWEPDILKKFTYNAEFPGSIIDVWHAMKGLDYKLFSGPFEEQIDKIYGVPGTAAQLAGQYVDQLGAEPTWATAYWYSHWILPSPTQGYLMWQRLNPDRDPKWDAPEMVGQNFSFDDLKLLLRANDYPPYFRPLLAAISHPIPGIRFMRDFVRNGVYQYQDIVEWGRRQGYSPLDSKNIADDVWLATQNAKAGKVNRTCLTVAKQAYLAGIFDVAALRDAITQCGLPAEQVENSVDEIDLSYQLARAKKVVASIRGRYLKGRLSEAEARNLLGQIPITGQPQDDLITDWDLERDEVGREVTAAQLSKLACQGFLPISELTSRLLNLGYAQDAVDAITIEAAVCQQAAFAKALAAQAKAEEKSAKAKQAAVKAAASQLKQCQRSLSSHGSPSKLREWYCQGFIGEAEVSSRLTFLGWPLVDISRLIADCKGVKDAKLDGLGGRLAVQGPPLTAQQACPPP